MQVGLSKVLSHGSVGRPTATILLTLAALLFALLLGSTATANAQEASFSAKVNFQSETAPVPSGYLRDFGQAYGSRTGADQGSGLSYGWVKQGDLSTPVSLVGNGRDRDKDTNQLLDTMMHMQLPANSQGLDNPGAWEIAVPNGAYTVKVAVGDAGGAVDSEHWINIENQNAISSFVPQATGAGRYANATRTVVVDDGKLTVQARSGTNTKIDYVDIASVSGAASRPYLTTQNVDNLSTGVDVNTSIVSDLNLPAGGVDPASLSSSTVQLHRVSDNAAIGAKVATSGGADTINLDPDAPLAPNTLYRFDVTNGVKDVKGNAFLPFSFVFTTGTSSGGGGGGGTGGGDIAFNKVASGANGQMFTSVTKGPDGKLYAGTITGNIYRYDIGSNGTLSNEQAITTVRDHASQAGLAGAPNRTVIGLTFDPASTADNPILWITDDYAYLGGNVPDYTGHIAKLTGPNLGTYTDVVENLPRSIKDHETNSVEFHNGLMYINQGSINAMGAPDSTWGNRPEHLLSAAVLTLDYKNLPSSLPIDVKTDSGGNYNPYASGAPLKLYATGVRNAYDLIWHSNGHLYVPTNGSAAGGNTPATPSPMPDSCKNRPDGGYNGPSAPAITNNRQSETDYIFDVKQGKYYGHPNPTRCEWILNAGNPNNYTSDPAFKVDAYPSGQKADPNYDLAGVYNAGLHASANGVIEYKGNAFGGALKGKLVVVRYSANQDLETFDVASGGALSNRTTGITGFTNFNQPLDVTEDTNTGNLYVTELGGQKITLLRPQSNTGTPNIDANPGRLIFNDVSGGAASASQKVTIKNTGSGPLNISNLSILGDNAGQFQITNKPALPATVAAGGSATVEVAFDPTSVGPKGATLRIDSDDPDAAQTDINLRGLGTQGIGGSNEPSLQWILDTYEIPVNVGDSDPTNNTMPSTSSPIGQEVLAKSFTKAEFDRPVSVEPIAVFGPQGPAGNPNVARVRAHDSGTPGTPLQTIFDVPNSSYQSLNPETANVQDFDPSGNFGFDWVWPALNHTTYQEDDQNTWETDAAARHKVRVYPLKDKSGAVVPAAYIVAPEDVKAPGVDYQDVVLIVRNVKPAAVEANNSKVELQNVDGVPFNDRLAFSRIQNPRTDKEPTHPQRVHDTATVRVKNTGTDPLTITGLPITGPWQLVNGPTLPATVPVGGQLDLTVKFTATSAGPNGGLYNGALNIQSDASNGPTPVELSGFWQSQSESGQEPTVAEVFKVMGWKTSVPSNLNENGSVVAVGDEVLSPYWKRADTAKPVDVTQLAGYHSWNNGAQFKWIKQDQSTLSSFDMNGDSAQSLLPWAPNSTTVIAGKSYTPAVSTFGFKVDGESSDDTKNDQTKDKSNGCPGPCGHHVRFFPVKDRAGDKVPGQYVVLMDYSGINYDYNDNMYLIKNIRPEKITAPANVNAVAGDGQVDLKWDANTESDLSGYNVYRGDSAQVDTSGTPLNGATPLTDPSYTDKDVTNGTAYYYVVQAVDQGGGKAASVAVRATPTAPSTNTDFKVNFQSAAAPVPSGYFRDFGQPYGARSDADQGSGMVYGWVEPGTNNPLDLSVGGSNNLGNGRDRNKNSDQRLDTLMHMQAGSATYASPFNGTAKDGSWEVSVPDGAYKVTVAAGDASANSDPESHSINVEGKNAIDNFVPSGAAGSDTRHKTATLNSVTVSDGRLTIDANGGQNTKIDYVDVAPATQAANQPPVVTSPGDQTGAEGDNVSLSVDASDPDAGDTLTYAATGLPGGLSIDPSTGKISGTIASGSAANSPFNVTVKATDKAGASDSKSFSWTVTSAQQASGCPPRSTLDCAKVPVALPYNATFDGTEGGLKDTGFTMVDPPSAPLSTPSNPDVPGYEPGNLTVAGSELTIKSTQGIMYVNPAKSPKTNSQVNALGVGVNASGKTTRIETNTTVPAFPSTANSEQGGLWFGLDEDNYAKLVVVNTGNGNAKIQLYREIGAVSNGESGDDEVNSANNVAKNGDAVKLTLVPDATAGNVTAFYTIGTGQEVKLGTLPVPANFFAGTKLNQSSTETASFAGIFDTNRRGTTPINMSFKNFSVASESQPQPNKAPVANDDTYNTDEDATLTVSAVDGVLSNDSDADVGDTLTATLVDDVKSGALTLDANGSFSYKPNSGFSGKDTFTYKANDGTDDSNVGTVSITVKAINHAPSIEQIGDQTATAGESFSLQVKASDPDQGDTLTYDATGLPQGLKINPDTGEISGTIASGAATGSPYSVKVTVTDGTKSATQNFQFQVKDPADTTAPATPTGFKATASDAGIALAWSANSEADLAGYNVYRRTADETEFTKLNTDLITNLQYNDTKAPEGVTSYYRLTAVDKAGNESNFALDSAKRPVPDTEAPATPTGFTATPSQSGIALDWADNSELDLAGYNVSRRVVGEDKFTKLNSDLLTDSKYDDTKAPAGKTSYYRVTAVDKAGNESGFAAESAFRPKAPDDTTAPNTSITGGPSGFTKSRTARFTFKSSEEGSTFECKLDGGSFESCTSPKQYTNLKDGRHTFQVKATDKAGNTDASAAKRTWNVDTKGPAIYKISPRNQTRDRTPTVRATIKDSQTNLAKSNIKLYFDGKRKNNFSYSQRTDRLSYTTGKLAKQRHTVKIVAVDEAGNRTVKVWRFRVN